MRIAQVAPLAESVCENPDIVLNKQLDALKRAKLDELKAQGVEYEERIAQLVFARFEAPTIVLEEELSETLRGEGGFGSTGVR